MLYLRFPHNKQVEASVRQLVIRVWHLGNNKNNGFDRCQFRNGSQRNLKVRICRACFLKLGAIDIWGWRILRDGAGVPVHSRRCLTASLASTHLMPMALSSLAETTKNVSRYYLRGVGGGGEDCPLVRIKGTE